MNDNRGFSPIGVFHAWVSQMERERQELEDELSYRQSPAYVDAALRQAGLLPTDVIRAIPITRVVMRIDASAATPTPIPATTATQVDRGVFQNPNWQAWRRLIWRFDE